LEKKSSYLQPSGVAICFDSTDANPFCLFSIARVDSDELSTGHDERILLGSFSTLSAKKQTSKNFFMEVRYFGPMRDLGAAMQHHGAACMLWKSQRPIDSLSF
jgi:hypothetical protein